MNIGRDIHKIFILEPSYAAIFFIHFYTCCYNADLHFIVKKYPQAA